MQKVFNLVMTLMLLFIGVNVHAQTDEEMTIYFDNTAGWATPYIHYWGGASQSTWPGVAMTPFKGNVWVYVVAEGTTGVLFNAGDGDTTKTPDFTFVNNHIYTKTGDRGQYATTAGIGEVVTDMDETPVYFDMQGRRVLNPSAGIYIVRRGAKVSKEYVRR